MFDCVRVVALFYIVFVLFTYVQCIFGSLFTLYIHIYIYQRERERERERESNVQCIKQS